MSFPGIIMSPGHVGGLAAWRSGESHSEEPMEERRPGSFGDECTDDAGEERAADGERPSGWRKFEMKAGWDGSGAYVPTSCGGGFITGERCTGETTWASGGTDGTVGKAAIAGAVGMHAGVHGAAHGAAHGRPCGMPHGRADEVHGSMGAHGLRCAIGMGATGAPCAYAARSDGTGGRKTRIDGFGFGLPIGTELERTLLWSRCGLQCGLCPGLCPLLAGSSMYANCGGASGSESRWSSSASMATSSIRSRSGHCCSCAWICASCCCRSSWCFRRPSGGDEWFMCGCAITVFDFCIPAHCCTTCSARLRASCTCFWSIFFATATRGGGSGEMDDRTVGGWSPPFSLDTDSGDDVTVGIFGADGRR